MLKEGWTPAYQGLVDQCVKSALIELDGKRTDRKHLEELLEGDHTSTIAMSLAVLEGGLILYDGLVNRDSVELGVGVAVLAGAMVALPRMVDNARKRKERRIEIKKKIDQIRDEETMLEGDLGVYRRFDADDMVFYAPEDHLGEQKTRIASGLRDMALLNLPSYGHFRTRRDYYRHIVGGRVFMNGLQYEQWSPELREFVEEKYKNCRLKSTKLEDFSEGAVAEGFSDKLIEKGWNGHCSPVPVDA